MFLEPCLPTSLLGRFRPPLPCPWAAIAHRVAAGLLSCCWCLLVNADRCPTLSPVLLLLVIVPRDIRALCFLLRARRAMMTGCYLRVAAPGCQGPIGPQLSAPVAQVLLWSPHSVSCTSWHTLQTLPIDGISLSALAALLPVPMRTLVPEQCYTCLTPAGLVPRASKAGWGLLT